MTGRLPCSYLLVLCCNYCWKRPRLGTVIPKEPNTHIISAWTFDPGRVASYVLSIAYMLLHWVPIFKGLKFVKEECRNMSY